MSDAPPTNERPSSPPRQVERFTLRVQPVYGPRLFASIAIVVGLLVVLGAHYVLEQGALLNFVVLVSLATVMTGILAFSGRSRFPMIIEVRPDRIHVPLPDGTLVAVRNRSIRGLFVQKRLFSGFFYLATEDRDFMLPVQLFEKGEAERMVQAIRTRILSEGAEGQRRIEILDYQTRRAKRAFARTPVVTWSTVAVLIIIHLYLAISEQFTGVLSVASLGAVSPELVEAAGPYLAITANWVHHTWQFQPLLVLPGLFILGSLVERLLGHGATALSIFGAGLIGGLMAAYYPNSPIHAGAVIPVAGLLGTLAFTAQRYGSRFPMGFRLTRQWWLWVVVLCMIVLSIHGFSLLGALWGLISNHTLSVYGLSIPGVLFGLLFGAGVATALTEKDPELPLTHSPRWTAWASLALIAVHIGAGVWAIEDLPGKKMKLERIAVENMNNADILNRYAWFLAISKEELSSEQEDLALVAIDRAVGLEQRAILRRGYLDTKAVMLYRMGRYQEAVEIELDIIEDEPNNLVYGTQFAKFLLNIPNKASLKSSTDLQNVSVSIEAPVSEKKAIQLNRKAASWIAKVEVKIPPIKPHVVYAPVFHPEENDQLYGLVRVPLASGVTTATVAVDLVSPSSEWKESLKIQPSYSVPGKASCKFWRVLPSALVSP